MLALREPVTDRSREHHAALNRSPLLSSVTSMIRLWSDKNLAREKRMDRRSFLKTAGVGAAGAGALAAPAIAQNVQRVRMVTT